MEFNDIMQERRSIRAFKQQDIPDDLLNSLLTQALESPSSSNSQPFKVAIAKGDVAKQIAKELTDKFWRSNAITKKPLPLKLWSFMTDESMPDSDYKPILGKYPGKFQARRIETGKGLYKVLDIDRKDAKGREEHMARNFYYFEAPVALFFFIDPRMKHTAMVDLGIFMQSLMLGATNAGLGTCAEGSLGIWRSPIDKYFTVPKEYKLVCGMAIGYPEDDVVNSYRPEKMTLEDLMIAPK